MIIHMAEGATIDQVERVINRITNDYGLRCETIVSGTTVIGVKGVASVVDEGRITELPGVERVIRITEKYKDAARSFHREDSIVLAGGRVPVGGAEPDVLRRPLRDRIGKAGNRIGAPGEGSRRGYPARFRR